MDETLKALNKGSMSKSPKSPEGQIRGPLRGRELVNPNIMQSAPEVNQKIAVCYSSRRSLSRPFSVTVLSLFFYFPVGGCKQQRERQEEREGEEFSRGQRERRSRQFAASRQRAAGDVWWWLVPQHAPAVGVTAGQRHQEVSTQKKSLYCWKLSHSFIRS